MNVEKTLRDRGKTHGDFSEQSAVAQAIKMAMQDSPNWHLLRDAHREALQFIASKIARALCGNIDEADHWHDIAGYAQLAERACRQPAPSAQSDRRAGIAMAEMQYDDAMSPNTLNTSDTVGPGEG